MEWGEAVEVMELAEMMAGRPDPVAQEVQVVTVGAP
jgi:hypothetical protein